MVIKVILLRFAQPTRLALATTEVIALWSVCNHQSKAHADEIIHVVRESHPTRNIEAFDSSKNVSQTRVVELQLSLLLLAFSHARSTPMSII